MMRHLVVLYLYCLYACSAYTSFGTGQYGRVKAIARNLLNGYKVEDARGRFADYKALIPAAVRLTFHDCVGGCDGCINFKNADNRGLENVIAELDRVYEKEKLATVLSRADFWALAGITALEEAAKRQRRCRRGCPSPKITFQWGRNDCKTAPSTSAKRTLPDNHGDLNHITSYFSKQFGLKQRETVALLGVHTLGVARRNNSGFQGPWVPRRDALDNRYYITMSTTNWTQTNVARPPWGGRPGWPPGWPRPTSPPPKYQWTSRTGNPHIMLNADIAFLRAITPDKTGKSSCIITCKASPTASIVNEFARSNTLWMAEFSAVYQKMITNGYEKLHAVGHTPDLG